jgi:hypothetical protein
MAKARPKAHPLPKETEAQRRVALCELRAIISALEYPPASEGSLRLAQRLRRFLPPPAREGTRPA